jgi:hypothetical protein
MVTLPIPQDSRVSPDLAYQWKGTSLYLPLTLVFCRYLPAHRSRVNRKGLSGAGTGTAASWHMPAVHEGIVPSRARVSARLQNLHCTHVLATHSLAFR